MNVDIALFEGDNLLERTRLLVMTRPQSATLQHFRVQYQLGATAADIVLDDFSGGIDLKRVTLDMPIHESSDWESLDLGNYTVAFWCRLDA